MNIGSVPLLLSMIAGPLYGKLELQVPTSDFYYARDAGQIVNKSPVIEGHEVYKGQKLLEYYVLDSDKHRVLYSKADGYVEFLDPSLLTEGPLTKGQLLFIITLYEVFGTYEKPHNLALSSITAGSDIWICNDMESWKFLVNEIKEDTILISANLDQKNFQLLDSLSKKQIMGMVLAPQLCKESNL